jgi:hypothetical protein
MPASGEERSKKRETCGCNLVVIGLCGIFNVRESQVGESMEKEFFWECGKGRHGGGRCGGGSLESLF